MPNRKAKVAFLGGSQVGKTLLFNFLSGFTRTGAYNSTTHCNFSTRYYLDIDLQYWDFPMELAKAYLRQAEHICLVFNRTNPKSLAVLDKFVTLSQRIAPDAILYLVCPGHPNHEAQAAQLVEDDDVYAFLDKHCIPYENYLPLCITSLASMNTLREHLVQTARSQSLYKMESAPKSLIQRSKRSSPNAVNGLFSPVRSFVNWMSSSQNPTPTPETQENDEILRF